jgi:hypothetical protein
MVSVGHKVHGLKYGQGNGFLRVIEIHTFLQRGSNAGGPMS